MREELLNHVRRYIIDEGLKGIQAFDTPNWMGDILYPVFYEDGVEIWYTSYYNYIEIFGLTDKEFHSLSDVIDIF